MMRPSARRVRSRRRVLFMSRRAQALGSLLRKRCFFVEPEITPKRIVSQALSSNLTCCRVHLDDLVLGTPSISKISASDCCARINAGLRVESHNDLSTEASVDSVDIELFPAAPSRREGLNSQIKSCEAGLNASDSPVQAPFSLVEDIRQNSPIQALKSSERQISSPDFVVDDVGNAQSASNRHSPDGTQAEGISKKDARQFRPFSRSKQHMNRQPTRDKSSTVSHQSYAAASRTSSQHTALGRFMRDLERYVELTQARGKVLPPPSASEPSVPSLRTVSALVPFRQDFKSVGMAVTSKDQAKRRVLPSERTRSRAKHGTNFVHEQGAEHCFTENRKYCDTGTTTEKRKMCRPENGTVDNGQPGIETEPHNQDSPFQLEESPSSCFPCFLCVPNPGAVRRKCDVRHPGGTCPKAFGHLSCTQSRHATRPKECQSKCAKVPQSLGSVGIFQHLPKRTPVAPSTHQRICNQPMAFFRPQYRRYFSTSHQCDSSTPSRYLAPEGSRQHAPDVQRVLHLKEHSLQKTLSVSSADRDETSVAEIVLFNAYSRSSSLECNAGSTGKGGRVRMTPARLQSQEAHLPFQGLSSKDSMKRIADLQDKPAVFDGSHKSGERGPKERRSNKTRRSARHGQCAHRLICRAGHRPVIPPRLSSLPRSQRPSQEETNHQMAENCVNVLKGLSVVIAAACDDNFEAELQARPACESGSSSLGVLLKDSASNLTT